LYAGIFAGIPVGVTAYHNSGLIPAGIAAGLLPVAAISPIAAWWLDPPAEHGAIAATRFLGRTFSGPEWTSEQPVAVYRIGTQNLETASAGIRQQARIQWGNVLQATRHPLKVIVRARSLNALPLLERTQSDARPAAREVATWLAAQIAAAGLVERERFLSFTAQDEHELRERATQIQKVFRLNRVDAQRLEPDQVALLRTRTWDPHAAEPRSMPEVLEEGWSEANADGWWTRAYDLAQLPAAILTDWMAQALNGEEAIDVAFDIEPEDPEQVKTWVLQPKINRMRTSAPSLKRSIALEQLVALYEAIERRRVMPFNVATTVLVRGVSRQDLRARCKLVEKTFSSMGAKLQLLRWEQADGLRQLDPAKAKPLWGRDKLCETGTLARTYPFSDNYLQLDGGVPWGEAGMRPCIFTPWVAGNKGPHMCWYGATNAGKGTGAHMLWSRLHLMQGVRIFGIDQDEQHEHCGRFLEYLGGRKLTPRDAQDAREIELHHDDGVVILDLSDCDEDTAGEIFAEWVQVVKAHMLAYPGRSIVFVDEATRIIENARAEKALRHTFERSRHWGQSSHAMTQRPSTWFGTRVGRAVQGNADAWWCGGQLPRELGEVAEALELTDEEKAFVRKVGIGAGLLVSGQRRVQLDLFNKLSPAEYAAFHSDPVVEPTPLPKSLEVVA
jgi:hypothetical protein